MEEEALEVCLKERRVWKRRLREEGRGRRAAGESDTA